MKHFLTKLLIIQMKTESVLKSKKKNLVADNQQMLKKSLHFLDSPIYLGLLASADLIIIGVCNLWYIIHFHQPLCL